MSEGLVESMTFVWPVSGKNDQTNGGQTNFRANFVYSGIMTHSPALYDVELTKVMVYAAQTATSQLSSYSFVWVLVVLTAHHEA